MTFAVCILRVLCAQQIVHTTEYTQYVHRSPVRLDGLAIHSACSEAAIHAAAFAISYSALGRLDVQCELLGMCIEDTLPRRLCMRN